MLYNSKNRFGGIIMNDTAMREKQITKTSLIGIIANIFLAGFKALVGIISGSIAIVLDAVNNLTDALSSVITIAGIKLAKRKPDNDHPFGHGRVEYFSAIIISGIVLAAGIMSLIESVKKIIHPEIPNYTVATIVIVAVAVVVKLLLGKYVKAQGVKFNSDALIASGADASFDAIISASTLLGAAITLIFKISVDGIIGAIISAFIIKAGIELFMEAIGSVMGARPDSETTKAIKQTVREIDGVMGAYDLVLHDYGPDKAIGSVHIEIPADMSAEQVHKLTKKIQLTVLEQYHIFLTVGIYAIDEAHNPQRKLINALALDHPGTLGTHGIYIDDDSRYASFDVLTDFTVADREELRKEIIAEVSANVLPDYTIDVSFDTNYSD